ncbi:hypothetical protein BC832DRAFT_134589 [Gaertneriomyces semiglobifer]|nr:hypothetical protein BC832DRAFT_134589 [Gaertneriomyces semiglobifer]
MPHAICALIVILSVASCTQGTCEVGQCARREARHQNAGGAEFDLGDLILIWEHLIGCMGHGCSFYSLEGKWVLIATLRIGRGKRLIAILGSWLRGCEKKGGGIMSFRQLAATGGHYFIGFVAFDHPLCTAWRYTPRVWAHVIGLAYEITRLSPR